MLSLELLAILMLASFFVLLLAGIPVGMTLAVSGLVFGYLGFGTCCSTCCRIASSASSPTPRCSPSRSSSSWA